MKDFIRSLESEIENVAAKIQNSPNGKRQEQRNLVSPDNCYQQGKKKRPKIFL